MQVKTSKFVCQQCGYESGKWMGKCPECGEWNTLVETLVSSSGRKSKTKNSKLNQITNVNPVPLNSIASKLTGRKSTQIGELDRVLGGGLVSGQVILIAGEPGIGKSTLLLQVADLLSRSGKVVVGSKEPQKGETVLYVSGEESVSQIKIRADRLGVKSAAINLLESTDIDEVVNMVGNNPDKPALLIVDSIQTVSTEDLSGMAGSVGQVRECAFRLVRLAKETGVSVFIVGHITKEGTVAGPSVLMHIVDTVLWFEGEKTGSLRMLRAVKNRFGPTDEVGIFEMGDGGLTGVTDPERAFLTSDRKTASGSITTIAMQGTRPILVEVQSLVVQSKMAFPKRVSQGVDVKRVELLLAVLIRRCGLPLYDYDVFLNIAGGISLKNDPSTDLAICLSIASSYFDKALDKAVIAFGEVGLLGDIRKVPSEEKRIKEAKRLGYKTVISSSLINSLQAVLKNYLR